MSIRFPRGSRALLAAARSATPTNISTAATKTSKQLVSGIMKTTPISPALQSVNPSNKREIFCDDKLKKVFDGKDKVGFLEIAKLLVPHFVKKDAIGH